MSKPHPGSVVHLLKQAHSAGNGGDYATKNRITGEVMERYPDRFTIDDEQVYGNIVGLTDKLSGFRFHVPRHVIPATVIDREYPLAKTAEDVSTQYLFSGQLLQVEGLSLMLNANLVRGLFSMFNVAGAECPMLNNFVNRFVQVITPEELAGRTVTENNRTYSFNLGGVHTRRIDEGPYSQIWEIVIKSAELQEIRRVYGLTPKPAWGYFGCAFAIRKRGVLSNNEISKT